MTEVLTNKGVRVRVVSLEPSDEFPIIGAAYVPAMAGWESQAWNLQGDTIYSYPYQDSRLDPDTAVLFPWKD